MPAGVSSDDEEYGGTVSDGGLTIIFPSGRPGGVGAADLYIATRASEAQAFAAPIGLSSVNSMASDLSPALSDDELTLYFASNRGGNGLYRLYAATRPTRADDFGAPALVVMDYTALGSVGGPNLSSDELTMYFDASAGGLGSYDMWMTTRASVGDPWSTPAPVPGVNTPGVDSKPAIDDGGLTLYYISDAFEAAQDLVVATRRDLASPFGTPSKVPLALNPGVGEYGADISADGLWMELSIHLGAPLMTNVWLSTRSCLD
jgi:hypothetical protein